MNSPSVVDGQLINVRISRNAHRILKTLATMENETMGDTLSRMLNEQADRMELPSAVERDTKGEQEDDDTDE